MSGQLWSGVFLRFCNIFPGIRACLLIRQPVSCVIRNYPYLYRITRHPAGAASREYPFMNLVCIPDMRASRTCFEKHVPVMVFPMPDPDDAPEPGNPVDAPEPNPDDAPEPGNPDDAPEPNPDDAPEPGSPDDVPEPDPDNAPEPLWPWKDCRGRYARNVRGFPKRLAG